MYLTGADPIDMTIQQLRMLEDILSEDARSFAAQRDTAGQPKGQMPLPGCANEDEL